ncbi:LPXTG cell wall anchor domain-containing protein [Neobacillus piezotolerans]|nr:LPXTG cell wall anchor domain-containing protein [Neobacillus piezotolerans]
MIFNILPMGAAFANQGGAAEDRDGFKMFKLEEGNLKNGTYKDPDGPLQVTLNFSVAGKTFGWESNIPVADVYVKAGNDGLSYTTGGFRGTGLVAPDNKDISHIAFYYKVEGGNNDDNGGQGDDKNPGNENNNGGGQENRDKKNKYTVNLIGGCNPLAKEFYFILKNGDRVELTNAAIDLDYDFEDILKIEVKLNSGKVLTFDRDDVVVESPKNENGTTVFKITCKDEEPEVDISKINLTSICSADPSKTREWRVTNNNDFDVAVQWQVYGTAQTGTVTVKANSTATFTTNTVQGANTVVLKYGDKQISVKASGGAQCPVTPPVPDLTKINLTSLCSVDPSKTREWRVTNNNDFDVTVQWQVVGTAQTGTVTVNANSIATFTTNTVGGANTVIIKYGDQQISVKASGGAQCPVTPPVPDLTKINLTSLCSVDPSNTREWRVTNNNDFDVTVQWQVVGTAQTGTVTVKANSIATFTTNTVQGANTVVLKYGAKQISVKASGGAQCPVTPPVPDLTKINLTSLCSVDPSKTREWRVTNNNDFDVTVQWQVVGTEQTGSVTVKANSTATFTTNTVGGSNTVIIKYDDKQISVKASGGAQCPVSPPVPDLTKIILETVCTDNPAATRAWKITNNNDSATTINWEIVGTDQKGSVTIAANSNTTITSTAVTGDNILKLTYNGNQFTIKTSTGLKCGDNGGGTTPPGDNSGGGGTTPPGDNSGGGGTTPTVPPVIVIPDNPTPGGPIVEAKELAWIKLLASGCANIGANGKILLNNGQALNFTFGENGALVDVNLDVSEIKGIEVELNGTQTTLTMDKLQATKLDSVLTVMIICESLTPPPIPGGPGNGGETDPGTGGGTDPGTVVNPEDPATGGESDENPPVTIGDNETPGGNVGGFDGSLPQTGESSPLPYYFIGMLLVVAGFGMLRASKVRS